MTVNFPNVTRLPEAAETVAETATSSPKDSLTLAPMRPGPAPRDGCEDDVTYAPFEPPSPPHRRSGRPAFVAGAVLAALILIPLAVDRIAADQAESRTATAFEQDMGTSERPEADVHGFPVLAQLASGALRDMDITAHELPADGSDRPLPVARLDLDLHGLYSGWCMSSPSAGWVCLPGVVQTVDRGGRGIAADSRGDQGRGGGPGAVVGPGLAILGSLLGTAYRGKLTHLIGGHLPAAALDTAKDSVGGGLAVAEQVAKNPTGGPQQAQALVDAVHESFAHGVAQTSLVGGIIMAAGTMIVLAVLPGRRSAVGHRTEEQKSGSSPTPGRRPRPTPRSSS